MSPCQYDSNPGILGWMNRTGYEMRMAFTPPMVARQQWVPNYITTSIPVTRMVSTQTVRTVTYNVTRMEQIHTVHKVPVSRVVMVPEEITVQRPVTVYRTVPIGTSVAWVPAGSVTATAAVPGLTPDRMGLRRREEKAVERAAERLEKKAFKEGERYECDKDRQQGSDLLDEAAPGTLGGKRSEIIIPQRKTSDQAGSQAVSQRLPSAVLMNGWVARNTPTTSEGQEPAGTVSVASAQK